MIAIIQGVYLILFSFLYEKKGFRWAWFLPLTLCITTVAILSLIVGSNKELPETTEQAERRMETIGTLLLPVFCLVHTFLTTKMMKLLGDKPTIQEHLFARICVYWGAALVTGAVFAAVAVLAGFAFLFLSQ